MSVPSNLEFLRKEAKALLKQCRAGDALAIGRIRLQLPSLANLDDRRISETIKLADVHHALAREKGHASWGDLKRDDSLVEQFLVAIRGTAFKEAQRTLAALPDIASESIHAACAIGDAEAVAHHLDRDPSLVNAEHGGWPPLMYSCGSLLSRVSARQSAGILECATLLLDRGGDPNVSYRTDLSDADSELSAFRRAMMCGNMPVALRLLQRGAKPKIQSWVAKAQEAAFMPDFFSTPDVRREVEEGLDRLRQQQGDGPLWGSDKWWFHASGQMDPPSVYIGMFRHLIERKGFDPHKTGINGQTMLHQAAQAGTSDLIELLLDHGADLNRLTPDGRTAFVLAVRAGKNLNADVLQARGTTAEGLRPIDQLVGACVRGDVAATKAILKSHPHVAAHVSAEDTEVLVRAAAMNILDRVKLMLACGFDPGRFGEGGVTALHAAAWHGHVEMVLLLLGFHAPVNSRDRTFGSSPLAWAAHGSKHRTTAEEDYCAIVNALVDAGADYEAAVSRSGVRPEDIANERVAVLLSKYWRG